MLDSLVHGSWLVHSEVMVHGPCGLMNPETGTQTQIQTGGWAWVGRGVAHGAL